MTKCGSPKIRALIQKYLGEEHVKIYDETIDACQLCNALKDEQTWAPLCPEYPNLKGITCEEINEFVREKPHEFFATQEYEDLCRRTSDPLQQIEHDETPEQRIIRFLFRVEKHMNEDEFIAFKEVISPYRVSVERIMEFIETIKFENDIQFTKDYLHHVKVYDRDEIYAAFKRIGKQIKDNYSKYSNILRDSSTIYVTTPRGGHEMLSIFAYANGIKKEQIPSDITWQIDIKPELQEEYGLSAITDEWIREKEISFEMNDTENVHMFGKDWMGNKSKEIKTIFIVDDIIASGKQIDRTTGELRDMFPNAEINSITLCKRETEEYMLESIAKRYYNDIETIGIEKFKELRSQDKLDHEYITCLFPHACPDGRADDIIIELMGDRCSPEKRISRRDL